MLGLLFPRHGSSDDESSDSDTEEDEEEDNYSFYSYERSELPTSLTFPSLLGPSVEVEKKKKKKDGDDDDDDDEEEDDYQDDEEDASSDGYGYDDDGSVVDDENSDESDDDEEPVGEDNNDEEEYLNSLTNKVLQDKLRERGLKVSGKKSILIDRLMGREETAEIISKPIVGRH